MRKIRESRKAKTPFLAVSREVLNESHNRFNLAFRDWVELLLRNEIVLSISAEIVFHSVR